MPPRAELSIPQTAYVVFGDTELPWLKWFLRPGFRHCYIVLNDGDHWIGCDPLAHYTDVAVLPVPADFDLPAWFRGQNLTVQHAAMNKSPHVLAPLAFYSCVEQVKRILGLHAPFIVTPYQLFCYLQKSQQRSV